MLFPRYGFARRFLIDSPELGPGSILSPSGASVTSASSSGAVPTVLSILSQRSDGSGDGSGAVAAGGVVAGIAVVLFCILTTLFFHLGRRSRVHAAASADVGASQTQQPKSDEVALSPITVKIYVRDFVPALHLRVLILYTTFFPFPYTQDPDDPTTFPSQVTMPTPIETGSTLANTQTSPPRGGLAREYHGLPIV